MVDVSSLWDDVEGKFKTFPSHRVKLHFLFPGISQSADFSATQRHDFGRMQSIRAFNVSSDANEMLKGLRYFERAAKTATPEKPPMSWGRVSRVCSIPFLPNFFFRKKTSSDRLTCGHLVAASSSCVTRPRVFSYKSRGLSNSVPQHTFWVKDRTNLSRICIFLQL